MLEYPRVMRIRQRLDHPRVADAAGETELQLRRLALGNRIRPGQTVALTAGSRGIAQIPIILRAVVEHLRGLRAAPFLVPAMGSHGGGTSDGQLALLAGLGITPETCGCPIRADMETEILCQSPLGFPVHLDRHAAGADHVLLVNRIKPHTDFTGIVESGLIKMLLIGLGKHEGAKTYHRAFRQFGFAETATAVAGEVLARSRVVAGLAIVENAHDETARIEAIPAEAIPAREPELLALAKQWLPQLPFAEIDLLLIDEIGKEISGAGLDTNVVGRKLELHKTAPGESPRVHYVAVRSLTEATRGNATGLGLAEFCRGRVLRQRDERTTRINCFTGGRPALAMAPVDFETDREILAAVAPLCNRNAPSEIRLVWIRNTLQTVELECSEAYQDLLRQQPELEMLRPPRALPFDAEGNLPDRVTEARF